MKILKNTLTELNKYHSFRVLLANVYPLLKKLKIINFLHKLNKSSLFDPYDHVGNIGKVVTRTYNLLDFDIKDRFDKYSVDFKKFVQVKKNFTFGFLLNPNKYDIYNIDKSCSTLGVQYIIYDIKNPSLYREIGKIICDGVFLYPNFNNNLINRNIFHEATQILSSETKLMIYPSIRELNIYESKRNLVNFLIINNIPHPATSVFFDYESAKNFIEKSEFPIVFKTHLGASAEGVEILINKNQANKLVRRLFFKQYLRKMEIDRRSVDWGYMILQEYIENVKEYRVIKVGDSWFCYQKWKTEKQTFLSGSGLKKMINPPEYVLNFCYEHATKFDFTTMCFDIFETNKGQLLVNELQTWFGSYDPSEMYVNNIPGRYYRKEGKWIFEPGFFNIYGNILLRLVHLISLLNKTTQV